MSEENKNIENKETPEDESIELVVEEEPVSPKQERKISLKTFIISAAAIAVATAMLCITVIGSVLQKNFANDINAIISEQTQNNGSSNSGGGNSLSGSAFSEVDIIDLLLENYFYGDVDKDTLTAESLRAYLAATGDIYAAYYTQEELEASNEEGAGRMYGIGVNIINAKVTIDGVNLAVLKITNVMKDSPALESGLKAGDMIAYVGTGDKKQSVNELGYDEALRLLKGEEKTKAEFTILRKKGDSYEEKSFKVERREVITESVYARVSTLDKKIGIIKIASFELKTPTQFEDAVEELKAKGCEKFVIDVRYNPGGYEISVAAVLSYFLDEGDVYIRTENKKGQVSEKKVSVVSGYTGDYASCNVSKEDIGKYKDLDMVVLCNEHTASAGELFTATFRDYDLGTIVGTTTFGKGKMQTTYSLEAFGLEGAVKFTTHMYKSAKSEGYDGIGIKPDITVEQSDEAKEYNIYDLPDEKDDQLRKAIEQFNK